MKYPRRRFVKPRTRVGSKRRRIGALPNKVRGATGADAKRIVSRESLALDLGAMKKDGGCIVQQFVKTLHLQLFDSIPYDLVLIMASYALDFQIVFAEDRLTEITSIIKPDVQITTSRVCTTLRMTWTNNRPNDFENEGFLVNDEREENPHAGWVRFGVRVNVPIHHTEEGVALMIGNVFEDREYSLVRTIDIRVLNGQVKSFDDSLIAGSIVADYTMPVFTSSGGLLTADHLLIKSLDFAFPSK